MLLVGSDITKEITPICFTPLYSVFRKKKKDEKTILGIKTVYQKNKLPCSTKILREFYFADSRFFVVCENKFLQFEMTEISAGNLFLRCSGSSSRIFK